jgi:hypothetical protein
MDKLIDKLTSYNLFTNLLPGVMYCLLSDKLLNTKLIQSDIVIGVFFYYFCGMLISRFSSVIVEPLLKATKFVTFAKYEHYLTAIAKDPQIGTLLETNNTYRSIVALFACILLTGAWTATLTKYPELESVAGYALVTIALSLFLFAYRKQNNYIKSRIAAQINQGTK